MRVRGEGEGDGGDGLRPLVSDEGAIGHRDHPELADGQLELELARRVAHLVRVRATVRLGLGSGSGLGLGLGLRLGLGLVAEVGARPFGQIALVRDLDLRDLDLRHLPCLRSLPPPPRPRPRPDQAGLQLIVPPATAQAETQASGAATQARSGRAVRPFAR